VAVKSIIGIEIFINCHWTWLMQSPWYKTLRDCTMKIWHTCQFRTFLKKCDARSISYCWTKVKKTQQQLRSVNYISISRMLSCFLRDSWISFLLLLISWHNVNDSHLMLITLKMLHFFLWHLKSLMFKLLCARNQWILICELNFLSVSSMDGL